MNVALLREIQRAIADVPERLDMDIVLATQQLPGSIWRQDIGQAVPARGTVGCIAGWANVLSGRPLPEGRCSCLEGCALTREAQKLLDLNDDQATRLFLEPGYPGHFDKFWKPAWPADLEEEYINARTPRQRALTTSRRIDLFIETDGAE